MITSVVVNLTMCGINSVGYILCCQLPFDIIIDFSCQILLDSIRYKRDLYGIFGSYPDTKRVMDLLRLSSSDCNTGEIRPC